MTKTKAKKTLALLDVHAILHRAYHALPEFESSKGEPTGALYGLCTMLIKLIKDVKPDYVVACYDLPGKTFRHEAYDAYKAGRAKADDALISQLKNSRKIFEAFNIPIYDSPGFEADDIIGTLAKKAELQNFDVYMMTPDKDFGQLVRDHVHIYKPGRMGNPYEILGVKEILEKWEIERVDQVIDILGLWEMLLIIYQVFQVLEKKLQKN